MTNVQWSETISIECPFEKATHNYTLVYLPRGQGTIVTTLDYVTNELGKEPDGKDANILRAFKCPTTGKHFKAEIELSIPPNMKEDNISVK